MHISSFLFILFSEPKEMQKFFRRRRIENAHCSLLSESKKDARTSSYCAMSNSIKIAATNYNCNL